LDAGDLFFKKYSTPYPENERSMLSERAHLMLKSLEWMGYHAIGIGDDDLGLGKKFLVDLSKVSQIPFLSSNVIDEDSGKTLFQRYVIKEVKGLRIGIFSLFSQDVFLTPSDPRKKGLVIRDPVETAQEMVRKLGPQTDLIILLSHLGYPKDMELAQKTSGIHIIVGSHTGTYLSTPPVVKNTIILQTASQGKYAGRIDLTLFSKGASFYNENTKRSLKNNLNRVQYQLTSRQTSEAQKAQWQKAKESYESALQQFEGKNPFTNVISPLSQQVKDHPDISKMVEAYKSKFPEKSEPPVHDSRGTYEPKP
jgi:2',3'-cyclic-nucleotide 2'-phosphodiesterase (5'-nucleotidase family)